MNPSPAHRLLLQHYDRLHKLGSYLSEMLQCDRDYILHDSDDEGYKVLLNALVAPNLESGQPHPKFEISPPMTDMREVIERAQERLFKGKGKARLTNIITLGYQLAQPGDVGSWGMSGIGITKQFENTIITALRAPEWETLLQRIGIDAMMHILTETSTFVHLPNGCLCQVTGDQLLFRRPLNSAPDHEKELPSSIPRKRRIVPKTNTGPPQKRARTGYRQAKSGTVGALVPLRQPPAEISFDRSRLFYARPSYAPHTRRIVVGLPAQHILNTIFPSYAKNKPDDIDPLGDEKLVKQREHGVRLLAQNIFMKQYNLDKNLPGVPRPKSLKTPKRLKDILPHLDRLLYKHSKCAYKPLRDKVCPSKVKAQDSKNLDSSAILEMMSEQSILLTQQSTASGNTTMVSDGPSIHLENSFRGKPRFIEFACSYNEVLRYVMVVTNAVIPKVFWGSKQNFKYIMERVKELISCRRFETLSLHDILQGFSTTACDWLIPPGPGASKQIRVSVSDFLKRRELLEEFLYWYFTSFVMPLLKTTFYITESSAFRNRVLYFRQDDWEILCAPLIERLSQKTFEKMEEVDAKEVLRQRTLGFSFVRLLPKDTGVRPIVNLKRKANNPMAYGPTGRSINQILLGAFQVLTYEKQMRPQLLGASVFSSDEIYSRLRKFKESLPRNTHGKLPKLYFVKMDVQACFDTIEQGKLLQIIKDLISQDTYMLRRHGQIVTSADRVKRIYVRKAVPEGDHCHFLRYATELAAVLRNVIFVDQVVYPPALKHKILHLLEEHITENIVKIDGTYYRQMVGIPQGSVLSALLCAFFYGDLEKQFGTFMDDPESVLLRLIDDYLFVTTSLSKAKQFLDMMSKGHPEYGCFIAKEKTLKNFDHGPEIMTTLEPQRKEFPWCGYLINMTDLSVSVDYSRYHGPNISDTLTVDRGRRPGFAFTTKMLLLAKSRSHIIFTDAVLNTEDVVYANIYQNLMLSAMKMHAYLRSWGAAFKGNDRLVRNTVQRMILFCYESIWSKTRGRAAKAYGTKCTVERRAAIWLGSHAFHTVLSRFPQRYRTLLKCLEIDIARGNLKFRRRFRKLILEAQAGLANIKMGV